VNQKERVGGLLMGEKKEFDELAGEKPIILPDLDIIKNFNFLDLYSKENGIYVHPNICKKIEEELKENRNKELEILYSLAKKNELKFNPGEKHSLEKLIKRNREIKNLGDEQLNSKLYKLLMTGANIALNERNAGIISNDGLLENAYLKLINKNSYLNFKNFSFYNFDSEGLFEKVEN
jgi:hypothetical protein